MKFKNLWNIIKQNLLLPLVFIIYVWFRSLESRIWILESRIQSLESRIWILESRIWVALGSNTYCTIMTITFEPLLRFYFFKMLDRLELNFLLIDHLSTCLPVTTRQKITTRWFCQNWLVLELPAKTDRDFEIWKSCLIEIFASGCNTKSIITRSIFKIEGSSFGFSLIFMGFKNHVLQLRLSDHLSKFSFF